MTVHCKRELRKTCWKSNIIAHSAAGTGVVAMWLLLATLLILYGLFRWYREREVVPNLPEKYVFITGCDSGFGNLLARQLDQHGLRVLAACLTSKGAEQLKERATQRLKTVVLDVTDSHSVAAAAHWVKQEVGDRGLWGLVNNAGIGIPSAPNEWLTKEDFLRVLNVNLVGVIDVTLNLLPLVRKANGRVVNMSSVAGRISCTGGGYSISKYGVEAFSDSLRRELSPFGVKVSIIEPGLFLTSIVECQALQDSVHRLWSCAPAEVQESYGQEYYDHFYRGLKDFVSRGNANLSLVTDCMQHALTAVHPRSRYSAGWDAKFFVLPLSYLPTMLSDKILAASWPYRLSAPKRDPEPPCDQRLTS